MFEAFQQNERPWSRLKQRRPCFFTYPSHTATKSCKAVEICRQSGFMIRMPNQTSSHTYMFKDDVWGLPIQWDFSKAKHSWHVLAKQLSPRYVRQWTILWESGVIFKLPNQTSPCTHICFGMMFKASLTNLGLSQDFNKGIPYLTCHNNTVTKLCDEAVKHPLTKLACD